MLRQTFSSALRGFRAHSKHVNTFSKAFLSTHSSFPDPYTNKHKSISEALVKEQPIVIVHAATAICDGGGGGLGHPIEFIQLESCEPHIPQVCKYCGTRYLGAKHKSNFLKWFAEEHGEAAASSVAFVESKYQPGKPIRWTNPEN